MLALVRFTNSSGTTRRPGSFSYEAALRSYDHPLSRSDDGNLRSSRETREQTRRCGRSWQKLSGVLSKPADLIRVCVPHLERRSISSTQPLMSSSLHLPSAICHLPASYHSQNSQHLLISRRLNSRKSFPTVQLHPSIPRRRKLSLRSASTYASLLPLNLSPDNLPSHPSPATQTLLGLLKALALFLLFAIDPDNSGGDTDGNGKDRVQSSELEEK
jgi:hypothetical protein